MRFQNPEMEGYKLPEVLNDGTYEVEITRANIQQIKDNMSLILDYSIVSGPTQADGTEPTGRDFSDFFQMTGLAAHKDQGKFAKHKLAEICAIADVNPFDLDTDKFIGVHLWIKNKTKPDNNGTLRENFSNYKKI